MRKLVSKFIFLMMGWKIIGTKEYPKRCVVISAPHTSNLDFLIGRCYAYILGIVPKYLIKSELFLPILGYLFRLDGGIPVNRNNKHDVVERISNLYKKDEFILGIAPEGTRKRVERWKTGFYHIANSANVPIVLVKMDYKLKEIGVIHQLSPSGDIEKDMLEIQKKFEHVVGKIPENYNPKIF